MVARRVARIRTPGGDNGKRQGDLSQSWHADHGAQLLSPHHSSGQPRPRPGGTPAKSRENADTGARPGASWHAGSPRTQRDVRENGRDVRGRTRKDGAAGNGTLPAPGASGGSECQDCAVFEILARRTKGAGADQAALID